MSKQTENGFDLEIIKALAEIIKENDLGKIKIKNADSEICVEAKPCPPPPPIGNIAAPPVIAADADTPTESKETTVSGNVCKSPIVGTFYAASAPDKEPFVSVGSQVHKGDVIYIIESMKVMSEVTCEFDGIIKEICVNNGDAVEFGQPIMIID